MRKRKATSRTLAVGITGGIASGKTEVSTVFRRKGALVIQSDDLAKELIATDTRLRNKIIRLLGKEAFTSRGRINAEYIAGRIFRESALRARVNAAVHPVVIARLRKLITAEKKKRSVPVVAVESALIHEAGIASMFDAVIVVTAPKYVRIERIRSRDGVSIAEARRRIDAQSGRVKTAREGDFIISNSADPGKLREASRLVFAILLAIAGRI